MSKVCKLWIHQSNFSEEDLVVNPKDFQNGPKEGDIIQIYQTFEDGSGTCKLLLQIPSLNTDFQQKETISLKHSVASKFKFRAYWDVHVDVVDPSACTLALVELKFKDQYLGRSDTWRFGKTLIDTALYTSKKLSFAGARAEVYEMWASDETVKKVTCGVVGKDTRVVFRSGSASVFIFIQMSKEMWEFDINGDLYFEKTVNGFFVELFKKWKEMKCNHSVTIVYFSRIFYDKNMLNNISDERRNSLSCDYQGRLYEDIYQVITHEERRDDWSPVIVTLKKHFIQYPECLKKENYPEGCLSSASEGNFLEVLNMGANVFEKAYIDRNLELTGQQMVVITPGAGMFEVDRELSTITKQRIVDNGMSADLVCMAEQPLHSVPLLKFHGKFGSSSLIGDDYGIPHWINHSFYTSKSQKYQRNGFIPRIKVPDVILQYQGVGSNRNPHTFLSEMHSDEIEQNKLPDFVDYEAYDAEVFKCAQTKPRPQTLMPGYNPYTRNRDHRVAGDIDGIEKFLKDEKLIPFGDVVKNSSSTELKRNSTDSGSAARSLGVVKSFACVKPKAYQDEVDGSDELLSYSPPLASQRAVVGSADTSFVYHNVGRPQRSLVNPFRPNYLPCKMTCNRHRWRHTFPKGPGGEMWQEHHHRISNHVHYHEDDHAQLTPLDPASEIEDDLSSLALESLEEDLDETDAPYMESDNDIQPLNSRQNRSATAGSAPSKHTAINMVGLGWIRKLHAPSEEDWTAAMKTSVDWKSLTFPACLPNTTDYNPDQRLLDNHYKVYTYDLCLQVDEDLSAQDEERVVMKPEDKLKEFLSQRIGQGFQLVCSNSSQNLAISSPINQPRSSVGVIPQGTPDEKYFFMMGRNFHKLTYTLSSEQVSFTRYHPTHVINVHPVSYPYRLWSDCTHEYVKMNARFVHDDMTNYNWNYMDQYIARDQDCLNLIDSLHCWRVRLALLPLKQPASVRSLSDDAEEKENEVQFKYLQGILRFLETVNRIRRPPVTKVKPKSTPTKSRRISAPAINLTKSPSSAVRTHRRSRSGGGSKDLETLDEDGEVVLDPTNSSPAFDINSVPARRRSSSSDNDDTTNSIPSLEEIVRDMRSKETGLNFLSEMRGLPPRCFLGTDATSWMIHHIHFIKARAEAVELGQRMLDEGFIQHASGSVLQPFVDGFYLYYIARSADRKPVKKPDKQSNELAYRTWAREQEEMLYEFQSKWFEVVLKERGSESSASPIGSFVNSEKVENSQNKISALSGSLNVGSKKIPSYRDAEINLDANTSDRPEWCTVTYHGIFCPDNAYGVELRWLVSTGSVINHLVQSWARKVTLYGFHLVPAPTFLIDQPARSDPFTISHYIPLDVAWLRGHVAFQGLTAIWGASCLREIIKEGNKKAFFGNFLGISAEEFKTRVFLFQEAILKRFGFIKDFPYNKGIYSSYQTGLKLGVYRYIHYTGALFMTIANQGNNDDSYGYRWILNYTLTKRWKSSVTLDNDAVRKLVKNIRVFCENKGGNLAKYVESFAVKCEDNPGAHDQEKLDNDVFERVLET